MFRLLAIVFFGALGVFGGTKAATTLYEDSLPAEESAPAPSFAPEEEAAAIPSERYHRYTCSCPSGCWVWGTFGVGNDPYDWWKMPFGTIILDDDPDLGRFPKPELDDKPNFWFCKGAGHKAHGN